MPLDENGLHVGEPGLITTWSGRRVDPMDLREDDITVNDIAHALSRQCRYNGHCFGFYSVARHSVFVSRMLWQDPVLSLWGLLHDAAEAYLGDLVRPLKHGNSVLGPTFMLAEEKAEEVIAKRFGLPYPMPPEVREADRVMLVERELPSNGYRWTWDSTPQRDEKAFLARYHQVITDACAYVPDIAGRDA